MGSAFSPDIWSDNLSTPTPITAVLVTHCPQLRAAQRLALDGQPQVRLLAQFEDGAAAADWLSRAAPDILIVDIDLADGRAMAVVEACAKRHPRCGILIWSRRCDAVVVHRCIDAGASGYLSGPNALAQLGAAVVALHGGGSPVSPDIARTIIDRARAGAASTPMPMPTPTPTPTPISMPPSSPIPVTPVLTRRETSVLELVARGGSDKEVARTLAISFRTVQTHLKNISGKLYANSRTEAVYQARQQGLLRP